MTVSVKAGSLKPHDVFAYHGQHIETLEVTPLAHDTAAHASMVEVMGTDTFGTQRWIDYGADEVVQVVSGPSTAVSVKAPEPVKTATQRAREAVRGGKVRSLPASASLVLYALAAAEDESATEQLVPSEGSIATGASLAISTTQGHLRSLASKGLVTRLGLGWTVL